MRLVIITGQTSTGKTDLALHLAHQYQADIINFDSRQIYQYLDIITNKDLPNNSSFNQVTTLDDFKIGFYNYDSPSSIKMWLYDIVKPDQYFSAYDFANCALQVIEKIVAEGKSIVLVGGTYFYLYHLLYDVNETNTPPNFTLREELKDTPLDELQETLQALDTQSFNRLNNSDKNNPQRLIRKIEILKNNNSGLGIFKPHQTITLEKKIKVKFSDIEFIGIRYKDKDAYKGTIKKKVQDRLKRDAIEEVKKVLKKGFTADNPGLKTIGYKQLIPYLHGTISKEEAVEQWITAELQYAKRQYTFMKRDKNIQWREV